MHLLLFSLPSPLTARFVDNFKLNDMQTTPTPSHRTAGRDRYIEEQDRLVATLCCAQPRRLNVGKVKSEKRLQKKKKPRCQQNLLSQGVTQQMRRTYEQGWRNCSRQLTATFSIPAILSPTSFHTCTFLHLYYKLWEIISNSGSLRLGRAWSGANCDKTWREHVLLTPMYAHPLFT